MHLLRYNKSCDDFELVTFHSDNVPPYAILSHTWGKDEITYRELLDGTGRDKSAYAKIRACGQKASAYNLEYFWVDTCCINKESSAELSESINSMYGWYEQAEICFAYIDDWTSDLEWSALTSIIPVEKSVAVTHSNEPKADAMVTVPDLDLTFKPNRDDVSVPPKGENSMKGPSLPSSSKGCQENHYPHRWFTRGWTLQKLIAPVKMEFFDASWASKGFKHEPIVAEELARITGVPAAILLDSTGTMLQEICHGQRMSWAAHRNTTRKEDIAYCLLGIFQVNMPLLYGEGTKAFLRLQELILTASTDLSLLAWSQDRNDQRMYRGILAKHPFEFGGLKQCRSDKSQWATEEEIITSNKGFRISTSLFRFKTRKDEITDILSLNHLSLGCYIEDSHVLSICLLRVKDYYVRALPNSVIKMDRHMVRRKTETIHLVRDFDELSNNRFASDTSGGVRIKLNVSKPYSLDLIESWPDGYFARPLGRFIVGDLRGFLGYLVLHINHCITDGDGPQDRTTIGRIMAVVDKDDSNETVLNLISEKQAEKLKAHVKRACKSDSFTARRALRDMLGPSWKTQERHVLVWDFVTNSLLRIDSRSRKVRRLGTDISEVVSFTVKAVTTVPDSRDRRYFSPHNSFMVEESVPFVGYLVIRVDERGQFIYPDPTLTLMVVIWRDEDLRFKAKVLHADQASNFKKDLELISRFDPVTAHERLTHILTQMWSDESTMGQNQTSPLHVGLEVLSSANVEYSSRSSLAARVVKVWLAHNDVS